MERTTTIASGHKQMRRLIQFAFLAVLLSSATSAFAQQWSGIIDDSRAIDWSQAGVVGGIPDRPVCQTLSPGATSSQINSALASCSGKKVVLSDGTYSNLGMIDFTNKKNVTLSASGADKVTLRFSSTGGCTGRATLICFGSSDTNWKGGASNQANWTGGYAKGTSVITLSAVPNLKVGFPIILDQTDDSCDSGGILVTQSQSSCSPSGSGVSGPYSLEGNGGGSQRTNRMQAQIVTVISCSGQTTQGASCSGSNVQVGISPAIYMPNWSSSRSPQAWWATNPNMGNGIENVSIDGNSYPSGQPIQLFNSVNTFVRGVRVTQGYRAHVQMEYSARTTIADSYFYLSQVSAPSNYGIECYGASDSLIVNNIVQAVTGPFLLNSACEGNVIAYNFAVNVFYQPSAGWNNPASSLHTAGVDFNLYEGNVFDGIDSDVFHGTHNFNTFYRNAFSGAQPVCYSGGGSYASATYGSCNNNRLSFKILAFSRFMNIVANVLGNGTATTYQGGGDRAIYGTIGSGNSNGSVTVPSDPNTGTTLLRWGNWDSVNNAARFVASEVPSNPSAAAQQPYANPMPTVGGPGQPPFPPSLVYNGKPSWWPAAKPWPSIGPEVTGGNLPSVAGHAYSNPAQDCYTKMGGTTNGSGNALTFNATSCYGAGATPQPNPPTNLTIVIQ
jgi:hypothetical protein